jgi:hypothetical protein
VVVVAAMGRAGGVVVGGWVLALRYAWVLLA